MIVTSHMYILKCFVTCCRLGVTYSDFLKDYAKKNQAFVASVEKALSDLVITAQKVRNYTLDIQLDYRLPFDST